MKKIVTISNKQATALRSVKRDPSPVKAGDFFVLDGAWDRKKVAVRVQNVYDLQESYWCHKCECMHKRVIPLKQFIDLQNVGRIYKDGRWVKPTRSSDIVQVEINYEMVDGFLKARQRHYSVYVKVVGVYAGGGLRVVANKSVDPKGGRFNSDGSYKGPYLTM